MQWQRIEKRDFGYAVQVPQHWTEQPPDLTNSPMETARFADPTDRRHSVVVFRGMPRPGLDVLTVAEHVRTTLAAHGYGDFRIAETQVGGRPGARLDCAKHDVGRVWAVREYIAVQDDIRFVLACGSTVPDEDDPLFTAMAEKFEILQPA